MTKKKPILLNGDAFRAVAASIKDFEEGRSSHWQQEQNNFKFDENSFANVGPMGTFSQSHGLVITTAHFVLQIPFRLFGLRFKYFWSIDKAARIIAKLQKRQYDLDLLRHVLTLAFLRKYVQLEDIGEPICIIGDGFANMASLILATLPKSRVILINLNKSLVVDLICLKNGIPGLSFGLARSPKELEFGLLQKDLRVLAITANNAHIMQGVNVGLAVNIESMMEMDPPIIKKYFDLLRSGSGAETIFYCCNRESKEFAGHGSSNFYEYPWQDDDKILVHETCPWTFFRYGNNFPFYTRRHKDLHRLVRLGKRS